MFYTVKKSLGQHFLHDEAVCQHIVDVVKEESCTQLVEVGPGAGAITKYLLQIPDISFIAVEIDNEKADYLEVTFLASKGKIKREDFLQSAPPFEGEFVVVGNFPYNISSQILFKIIDWKEQVTVIIGMFQKEVAQRVAAKPGSKVYGIISVLVQAFYEVEYLFDVPPEAFTPPPKVMSGVIRLRRKKETLAVKSDRAFTVLVKTAFNQRRKMLRNATRSLFDDVVLQDEIFNKRAEQLSLADFAQLSFLMK